MKFLYPALISPNVRTHARRYYIRGNLFLIRKRLQWGFKTLCMRMGFGFLYSSPFTRFTLFTCKFSENFDSIFLVNMHIENWVLAHTGHHILKI